MATLKEWPFICECGKKKKELKWSDDTTPVLCECGKEMSYDEEAVNDAPAYVTHKKGRSQKESTERRLNDFKKNILPTIASKREKRYFKKKHGWK